MRERPSRPDRTRGDQWAPTGREVSGLLPIARDALRRALDLKRTASVVHARDATLANLNHLEVQVEEGWRTCWSVNAKDLIAVLLLEHSV